MKVFLAFHLDKSNDSKLWLSHQCIRSPRVSSWLSAFWAQGGFALWKPLEVLQAHVPASSPWESSGLVVRWVSSGLLTYTCVMALVNNTISHTSNLLRVDLKGSHHALTQKAVIWGDGCVNRLYCSCLFAIYMSITSCFTPSTYSVLYVK